MWLHRFFGSLYMYGLVSHLSPPSIPPPPPTPRAETFLSLHHPNELDPTGYRD
jgi:hypothetical protein